MKQITVTSKTHGVKNILLDDEDYERVIQFKWSIFKGGKNYYATRRIDRKTTLPLHRFIMNESNPKIMIDHIDHNGLNCQKNNMRRCDKSQNQMNSTSQIGSSSMYLGVYFHVSTHKRNDKITRHPGWAAKIKVNGKGISLGKYKTEFEAAKAYNSAAMKHHGEFANINIL